MKKRSAVLLAIVWVLSLGLVGGIVSAQSPSDRGPLNGLTLPTVLAGPDVGFRVESSRNGIPTGRLVVRVNGAWVEAQLGGSGLVPANGR